MSFLTLKDRVSLGDTVVVYINFKTFYGLCVKQGEVFQTKFGALRHDDLIGHPYGHKFHLSKGWIYILESSPRLWTHTLNHRTQILYTTDISLILTQLEISPGKNVIEAGTGSASLSHSIARTIAPNGHLYTFDFHEERVASAHEDLKVHGLDHLVTVTQRDVCQDGFSPIVPRPVDCLFLDLPHPWKVIPFARESLKSMGRICTFSPCIEQVQRTCEALTENNFGEIATYECILRPYDVRQLQMNKLPAKYERRPWQDDKRQRNKKDKGKNSDGHAGSSSSPPAKKSKLGYDKGENEEEPGDQEDGEGDGKVERARESNDLLEKGEEGMEVSATSLSRNSESHLPTTASKSETCTYTGAFPITDIAGHTGFLTFATKYL